VMIIKKKGLFVRVPKNASTSIISSFKDNNISIKSKELADLKLLLKDKSKGILYSKTGYMSRLITRHSENLDLDKVFSFGFVRNPYARAVSSFKLHSNELLVDQWRTKKRKDFKEFLNLLLDKNLNPCEIFYNPEILMACEQYPFLIDDKQNISVDFIGKVENVQQDIDYIMDVLGLPKIIIPHLNSTKTESYKKFYDNECKKIVEKLYEKDLSHFKYTFEDIN
jgi:hypothetical protein